MDIIEKNKTRISRLAAKSPKLSKQVEDLDWDELRSALNECIFKKNDVGLPDEYGPASYFPLAPKNSEQEALYARAFKHGEDIIRAGKTAAFTVAGGQGTRLGYNGPKGTLPVSPIKKKPLFQLFGEQIRGMSQKYEVIIPWYIMCSPLNLEATSAHFKENNYYGLGEENIKFFAQGVIPATDFEGNLLLASQESLALSPNGHGGSLKALIDSGSVLDMAERGVEHISYFQVDNPLVSTINPLFMGLHALQKSDMSSRSLTKTGPYEKLGNFVSTDDRITIIEYSDLPEEKALEKDSDSQIKYRAGSPAIHILRRDFIEQFASGNIKLPFHRAEKKVSFVKDDGSLVTPNEPNAIKFETFVFDALPFAKCPLILEADRIEEFSPVKNMTGTDSLESSQADQSKRAHKWLAEAGYKTMESSVIEICPLSYPTALDLSEADLSDHDLSTNELYIGK
ncbi:MAG: UTP--glucose-1-phosphate uridylyltransferase [Opitutales bacterium]|nr:UTP--glucose-1-phosphate uridylyltransferase [Opitutales bacterium]